MKLIKKVPRHDYGSSSNDKILLEFPVENYVISHSWTTMLQYCGSVKTSMKN
ncbi:hypothetical protein [Lysinibacillus endophyticus]|uniref:hypothetical protein n=1 Tax=Ureibacillus endophyticus TaxID=1978490 RepID=UPI00313666FC